MADQKNTGSPGRRRLKQWLNNGRLRNHKTSKNEISNLFVIVDRDFKDADELIEFVTEFKTDKVASLKNHHSDLG
jgi:hypothetical protein